MQDSNPKAIQTIDLPARVRHIGRDCEGDDHYVVPGDRVYVVHHGVKGDELTHEQPLGDASLRTWAEYVADRRGWICCTVDERPMSEWLLDKRIPQEAGR